MNPETKIILIVDDDADYLFQMKHKVSQFGFQVITAEGQKEAEKILESIRPDLAILDLMMETDDSGFILSYKIKSRYPGLPVIISTGVTAETGIQFDATPGEDTNWIKADVFLDKGIRTDQLYKEIMKLLNI